MNLQRFVPSFFRCHLFLPFFIVLLISKKRGEFFSKLLKSTTLWHNSFVCLLSGFADVFDVDYFIQQMDGYVKVVKDLPPEIASREPFRVDTSKRKGQFDYIESILPSLLEHHYISITPAMSQRRDRYHIIFWHCSYTNLTWRQLLH